MAVEIDRKEIYRYLGYRGQEADLSAKELVEACIRELYEAAEPRAAMREYPLSMSEDGIIDCGCFCIKSDSLMRNLGGCGQVLLAAVTLGIGVDRLLLKYGKLQVSKAVVMQAAAAAMIEAYFNEQCSGWKEEYAACGLYLRPRFSPGYGDFSLNCQQNILDGLDAGKRLGIGLTDGGLMVPTKSVTAVIGVGREECPGYAEGCETCSKENCLFRRMG